MVQENSLFRNYLGDVLYNHMATTVNMILGIQAASAGGKSPLVENESENLSITTKRAAITNPMAK